MKQRLRGEILEQKLGSIVQAVIRYASGRNTIRKLAADAGAVVRIGKCVKYNFSILDRYVDELSGCE